MCETIRCKTLRHCLLITSEFHVLKIELLEKFKKPALKRVRISADQMLKTLLGSKGKATQIDMRSQLKKKPVEAKAE